MLQCSNKVQWQNMTEWLTTTLLATAISGKKKGKTELKLRLFITAQILHSARTWVNIPYAGPLERCRCGVETKGLSAVFTVTMITWIWFNSRPRRVVASLDKALYDIYFCSVASNKQQINWKKVKESTGKLGNGQLPSGCGFVHKYSATSLSRDRRIKMK